MFEDSIEEKEETKIPEPITGKQRVEPKEDFNIIDFEDFESESSLKENKKQQNKKANQISEEENEADLQKELEAKFDELFGPMEEN